MPASGARWSFDGDQAGRNGAIGVSQDRRVGRAPDWRKPQGDGRPCLGDQPGIILHVSDPDVMNARDGTQSLNPIARIDLGRRTILTGSGAATGALVTVPE